MSNKKYDRFRKIYATMKKIQIKNGDTEEKSLTRRVAHCSTVRQVPII